MKILKTWIKSIRERVKPSLLVTSLMILTLALLGTQPESRAQVAAPTQSDLLARMKPMKKYFK